MSMCDCVKEKCTVKRLTGKQRRNAIACVSNISFIYYCYFYVGCCYYYYFSPIPPLCSYKRFILFSIIYCFFCCVGPKYEYTITHTYTYSDSLERVCSWFGEKKTKKNSKLAYTAIV